MEGTLAITANTSATEFEQQRRVAPPSETHQPQPCRQQ
jgi:hypothetical protein